MSSHIGEYRGRQAQWPPPAAQTPPIAKEMKKKKKKPVVEESSTSSTEGSSEEEEDEDDEEESDESEEEVCKHAASLRAKERMLLCKVLVCPLLQDANTTASAKPKSSTAEVFQQFA